MSVSVNVLAPNGRRQTVKCSPNTTILQIIEEVCKKQGFNAIEYDIKHHNKVLDTTCTIRFSGLPNNAQLELVAAVRNRTEGDITLAVNLEDGSRITETFTPNDTLLNILNKVCPENASLDKHPVVIYTRREIFGKELENCTLRSLGLLGGRAMIRVLNKAPEQLHQQANVSAPLPSKPVEEKPYIRKFQHVEDKPPSQKLPETSKNDEEDRIGGVDTQPEPTIKPQKNMKNPTTDLLKLVKDKRKSLEARSPDLHKEKKLMVDEDKKPVEKMDVDSNSEPKKAVPEKSIEEEFVFCGKRNGMIFSLESALSVPHEDLPDEFFELTIDDARKILRDVKRERHEMDNRMLKTSQLRNFEETKKQLRQLNRYKKAIIRVQFPDRTVVQGIFKPTETIQDVLNFIRDYLEDQNLEFYIYATPPKSILQKEARLIEIGCVPGALLYFGTHKDQKDSFLKRDLQDMFTTNSVASLAAAKIRHANTRKIQEPDDDFCMDADDGPGTSSAPVNYGASTSSGGSGTSARKVVSNESEFPKWFKPL